MLPPAVFYYTPIGGGIKITIFFGRHAGKILEQLDKMAL